MTTSSPVEQAQHFLLSTASLSILGYENNLAVESAILLCNVVPNDALYSSFPGQAEHETG